MDKKHQELNEESRLTRLWEAHRSAGWPSALGPQEGELMMLDTVISGCITYFLESEGELDQQRVEILQGCLTDLDHLLPELEEEAVPYFQRLRALGSLLLAGC